MEVQIKKAIKAGNSSAVILPRYWLNKEVRVEIVKKSNEKILHETLEILKKYIDLKDIIGVYLIGSYARDEEDEYSDIDILVITSNVDREMISEGIYNIFVVSRVLINQKLNQDLLPIGQMIKEAKPLLNKYYLNSINIKVKKNNIKWYLNTTTDKLRIIKKIINKTKNSNKKYIHDRIIYTLVLRIRTLHIIKKLLKNENYSKKEFIRIITKLSGITAYYRYLAVKNNSREKSEITVDKVEILYKYLNSRLEEIKKLIR